MSKITSKKALKILNEEADKTDKRKREIALSYMDKVYITERNENYKYLLYAINRLELVKAIYEDSNLIIMDNEDFIDGLRSIFNDDGIETNYLTMDPYGFSSHDNNVYILEINKEDRVTIKLKYGI